MTIIFVHRHHALGKEAARDLTLRIAEQLGQSLKLNYRWEGESLRFSGTGVGGMIRIGDTDLRVEVNLGWMLTPLRGRIEQQINAYLDTHLA